MTEADIRRALRIVQGGAPRPQGGKTLSQFVLEAGGLVDDARELASRGITNKARPGLIRREKRSLFGDQLGGWTLDDMARHAWENGYFPDRVNRPLVDEFVEALNDDFHKIRAILKREDVDEFALTDFIARLEADLTRAGVDIGGKAPRFATSDEMRGAVERVYQALDAEADYKVAALRDRLTQREADTRVERDARFMGDPKEMGKAIADEIFDTLTGRTDAVPAGAITIKARGPLKERTFDIPDLFVGANGKAVESYLDHDVEMIGRRYARTMAADIELTDRFGSADLKGQVEAVRNEYADLRQAVETNADLSAADRARQLANLNTREKSDVGDIEAVRDMLRGVYRPEIQNTPWARVLRGAMTFNYMRSLGGVLIASLTDAVRPAMVHGLASYMQDGIAPLVRNMKAVNMSREEAKLAGAISERVLASRMATLAELTDPYARNSPFERFLENASAGFSKMTGLLHWNDFHKSIASTMVQNRILQNAEIAARDGFDALPVAERAYMGFLGIGKGNAERLGALFKDHGETLDGVRVANTQGWGDDPAADFIRRAYRAAINKDVDSIIVTKGVGDVPLFANTPVGRAIIQFKGFALATNQRVLLRGLQEQPTRLIGGVAGMAAIGAFVYALKQIENGRPISDNPGTFIAEGLDRSGIFAVAFEANNALEKAGAPGFFTGAAALFPKASQKQPASRYATRSAVGGFLGPSFGSATDVVGLLSLGLANLNRVAGGEGRPLAPGDVAAVRRLTPYASLPYWRWLIDRMAVPKLKEAAQ